MTVRFTGRGAIRADVVVGLAVRSPVLVVAALVRVVARRRGGIGEGHERRRGKRGRESSEQTPGPTRRVRHALPTPLISQNGTPGLKEIRRRASFLTRREAEARR